MSTSLKNQTCQACSVGAPLIQPEAYQSFLDQLSDWHIITIDHIDRLTKVYSFKNFKKALDFANQVGEIAEDAGHHPALLVEWGQVTVTWWSHEAGGLHQNDFIMAAKTDALL